MIERVVFTPEADDGLSRSCGLHEFMDAIRMEVYLVCSTTSQLRNARRELDAEVLDVLPGFVHSGEVFEE